MDDRLVSAFPSLENKGGDSDLSSPKSYTEIFYEYFPFYLAEGMSYDAFWNDDVDIVKYYRKAYKIRRDDINFAAYLQGKYVYDALLCVAPVLHPFSKTNKPHDYLDKPYELNDNVKRETPEDKEKTNYENGLLMMRAYMAAYNKEKKGESDNG